VRAYGEPMKEGKVHLEDVTSAARRGIALGFAASLLALVAMLIAGIPLPGATALLVLGSASGGFGLVAGLALRSPRSRGGAAGGGAVAPLRVPQPR
jgi:hypothetical protein